MTFKRLAGIPNVALLVRPMVPTPAKLVFKSYFMCINYAISHINATSLHTDCRNKLVTLMPHHCILTAGIN